jgi:hypothetical protein
MLIPNDFRAEKIMYMTPREVAPARPLLPPIETGFPVTTPGTE